MQSHSSLTTQIFAPALTCNHISSWQQKHPAQLQINYWPNAILLQQHLYELEPGRECDSSVKQSCPWSPALTSLCLNARHGARFSKLFALLCGSFCRACSAFRYRFMGFSEAEEGMASIDSSSPFAKHLPLGRRLVPRSRCSLRMGRISRLSGGCYTMPSRCWELHIKPAISSIALVIYG